MAALTPLRSGLALSARARPRRMPLRVAAAIKLYSNPASRGRIIEWYIKEHPNKLQIEIVNLDMREKREHKSEDFKKINPFGKVPALTDGDLKLYESGAILLYLAELVGETTTPAQRAEAAKWALFANSTLSNGLFLEQFRERQMPEIMGGLDQILAKQDHIAGPAFSVSDVLVGAYLLYLPAFHPTLDISPYKHVLAYMERLASRPACAATVGARALIKKEGAAAAAGAPAAAKKQ